MKYVLKKTGILIITLILISLLAFLAFQIIPGDPVTKILGTDYTPQKAEALREQLGLNGNFFERYFRWMKGLVMGDPGISYSYFMPVKEVLKGKVSLTATLSLISWVIVTLISIPLGIIMVRYQNETFRKISVSLNQIFMAIPPFFLGMLLAYLFGLILKVFTPGVYVPLSQDFGRGLVYLLFPALAISLPKTSFPASLFRLKDRGVIKPGYFADLTVFDPAKLDCKADFAHPHTPADGIVRVYVNGEPADGGRRAGRALV